MRATHQTVESLRDGQLDRRRNEVLEWLTPTDYATQQRDHLRRRHAGTGQWLLDSDVFGSWLSEPGQTLLCPGIPGAGKTIMASIVIDDLPQRFSGREDVGLAYIYFNFKDPAKQEVHDLLSSLVKQLAQSRPSLPEALGSTYDAHEKKRTKMSTQEVLDSLHSIASSFSRLFVVMDALDECNAESRQAFLKGIRQLQENHPVSILATTRQVPDIVDGFGDCVCLHIKASDDDVLQYISSRLPGMQSFVRSQPEIQEKIKKGVLARTAGM